MKIIILSFSQSRNFMNAPVLFVTGNNLLREMAQLICPVFFKRYFLQKVTSTEIICFTKHTQRYESYTKTFSI